MDCSGPVKPMAGCSLNFICFQCGQPGARFDDLRSYRRFCSHECFQVAQKGPLTAFRDHYWDWFTYIAAFHDSVLGAPPPYWVQRCPTSRQVLDMRSVSFRFKSLLAAQGPPSCPTCKQGPWRVGPVELSLCESPDEILVSTCCMNCEEEDKKTSPLGVIVRHRPRSKTDKGPYFIPFHKLKNYVSLRPVFDDASL